MSRCERPGCAGVVLATGFCDRRGHRQESSGRTAPPNPESRSGRVAPVGRSVSSASGHLDSDATGRTLRTAARQRFSVLPGGAGPLDLPLVELPDPAALVVTDPRLSVHRRRCQRDGCNNPIGRPYGDRPGLVRGYCSRCGHPFDFTPQLAAGDLLGEQYQVLGPLAYGGNGWVYLASQAALDDRLVAIKGLINPYDDRALREVVAERRNLTALSHPNIVRILSYETQPVADGATLAGYLVMDFLPGMSLSQIRDVIAGGEEPFDGPRVYEYLLTYGCLILQALEYLHAKELLYCDMKPRNVIHHGGRIGLIDLGAVRRFDDTTTPVTSTPGYTAPEVERDHAAGLSVRSDLYGVGKTLHTLADKTRQSPHGLADESFRRAVARATARDPRARYASAREMSEQVCGVLLEARALRTGLAQPQPSTLFAAPVELLDSGLGAAPPLAQWLSGGPSGLSAYGVPPPATVPAALPEPLPNPDDPGAALLRSPVVGGPGRQLDQLAAFGPESAEVRLRQCRLHLRLAEPDTAAVRLAEAALIVGDDGPYDWRLAWHRGLLALAVGDVPAARREFDAVYRDLPGEYAPKLALGYCAEHGAVARRADRELAERCYQAVWQRDRTLASAAFGLVRLRIEDTDRGGALAVLDAVPQVSLHHDAARVAAARVLIGELGSPDAAPPGRSPTAAQRALALPSAASLTEFLARRPHLPLAGDDGTVSPDLVRLDAEAVRAALRRLAYQPADGHSRLLDRLLTELSGAPTHRDRRAPLTAREALCDKLASLLREIAQQAPDLDSLGVLVDQANRITPMSRF